MHARGCVSAQHGASPSDRLLNDLRGLIGSEQVELEFD